MSNLIIVRHGQASFGQKNYDQLSPVGYRQAQVVANHLQETGVGFDAVYTGQLTRQRQTFQTMANVFAENGRPLPESSTMPDLDEYDSTGVWEYYYPIMVRENPHLKLDETRLAEDPKAFQKVFSRIVQRWMNETQDRPGLESWHSFRARIGSGLKKIMQQVGSGKNVMVFSSAGPIAVAVQMATQMPDDQCIGISWQVLNASMTRFRFNAEKMTLTGFNDVAALERQGDPGLLTYR